MKKTALLLALCLALLPLCASAEGLTAQQQEYVKGALHVPRDILVTNYSYSGTYYWEAGEQWLLSVDLYSNGELLAGAALNVDRLTLERDILIYDEDAVNTSAVKHQRVGDWSMSDAAYLKGAFHIPWNVEATCEVYAPYYWDGGGIWLSEVDFHGRDGELLACAAIEADSASVSMVRNIYTYSEY